MPGVHARQYGWVCECGNRLGDDLMWKCGRKYKKVAVLTYTVKHRKTYDVLCLLKANGYDDVVVYASPLHYKKKTYPMIQHRPELNYAIPEMKELCLNFGYKYIIGQIQDFNIDSDRVVLVAGAGILPDEFVNSHTVINAHPGYIPNCRGLDALKWAIVEDEPVGVTTHLIGTKVDAGWVIERRNIQLNKTDTFHALAQRVYENEVSMLIEAIRKCDKAQMEYISPEGYEVHRRMPADVESGLFVHFDLYKIRHAVEYKELIGGGGGIKEI